MPNIEEKLNSIIQGQIAFMDEVRENLNTVTEAYPYQVKHEPIITLTLAQELELIISKNPELSTRTCYGGRISLKNGDVLPISLSICDKAFVNGREYTNNYIYTGKNQEIVTVFYFASSNGLTLPIVNLNTIDVLIKNSVGALNVDKSWYSVMNDLTVIGNVDVSAAYCNNCYIEIFEISHLNKVIPANMKIFKTNCNQFGADTLFFNGRSLCTTMDFSNVETITATTNIGGIIRAVNSNCVIKFPKLKTIYATSNGTMIDNFKDIVLPDSLLIVGKGSFRGITNLFDMTGGINASFDNNWYTGSVYPETVIVPDGWHYNLPLYNVASKQDKEWFLRVFEGLADVTSIGTRIITIPTKIIVQLTETEINIARNKGWSVESA